MMNRTICIDFDLFSKSSHCDEGVRVLQRKLYIRAKKEPNFKAYSLWDKLCEDAILITAYNRVKSNYSKGVGVDRMSFEDIEKQGVISFLSNLKRDFINQSYRCLPIKRVLIPKEKGKFRKLGIPTIRDRVAQMAVKMLIEPLWEANFEDTSYGFRPKRSAKDAIKQVKANIYAGHHFVYDADLSKYFDNIPHHKLFKLLRKRIADDYILSLLSQWVKAPVLLPNGNLVKSEIGSPQGGVISPLLSNIYLDIFDKIVNNPNGQFKQNKILMVRYADDWLLMSKYYFTNSILSYLDRIMKNMELSINKEKTKLLDTNRDSLYFLGFEFYRTKSKFKWNKRSYTSIRPSMKSRSKLFTKLRELLAKRRHWTIEWISWKLNELLFGWLNYFSISKTTHIWDTIKIIKVHLDYKLFKWMKSKGRKAHKVLRQNPYQNLVKFYKLIDLEKYARLKTLSKAQ